MTLTLLPAVDVAGGPGVRLVQGAAGAPTGWGEPVVPPAQMSAGARASGGSSGIPVSRQRWTRTSASIP